MLSIVPKSAIPDLTEYIYDVIQHQIFFIDVHSKMFPWSGSPTAYVAEGSIQTGSLGLVSITKNPARVGPVLTNLINRTPSSVIDLHILIEQK